MTKLSERIFLTRKAGGRLYTPILDDEEYQQLIKLEHKSELWDKSEDKRILDGQIEHQNKGHKDNDSAGCYCEN